MSVISSLLVVNVCVLLVSTSLDPIGPNPTQINGGIMKHELSTASFLFD